MIGLSRFFIELDTPSQHSRQEASQNAPIRILGRWWDGFIPTLWMATHLSIQWNIVPRYETISITIPQVDSRNFM